MGMNDSDPIEERDILKLLEMLEEPRIKKMIKEILKGENKNAN